jgi:hypothetical protein
VGKEYSRHKKRGMNVGFLWENRTEIDHQEDVVVSGRVIL